ncbi:MAG TPA: hypothetical protein VGI22_14065 [Xanthobacteraceae bacterium]|jgi:hypothetical protein
MIRSYSGSCGERKNGGGPRSTPAICARWRTARLEHVHGLPVGWQFVIRQAGKVVLDLLELAATHEQAACKPGDEEDKAFVPLVLGPPQRIEPEGPEAADDPGRVLGPEQLGEPGVQEHRDEIKAGKLIGSSGASRPKASATSPRFKRCSKPSTSAPITSQIFPRSA